jgi:hypothetical protein
MDLQVHVPDSRCRRHEGRRPSLAWIGDVEDGEAAVAGLTDVRMIVVHHDLDAVGPSTLIGVAQPA